MPAARLLFFLPLFCAPLCAQSLDMDGIKKIYRDGELDAVRERLELFFKRDPASATREERVFASKYLGVIYAAKPESRAKAEALFNQALDLSPNLGLAEMYASQPVEDMFLRIKTDHAAKTQELSRVDEFGNSVGTAPNPPVPPRGAGKTVGKLGKPVWPWLLGGAAAAAAGVGIFLWLGSGGGGTTTISAGG